MGWCEGSYMAEEVWKRIKPYIPEDKRRAEARALMDLFWDHDADCWENEMLIVVDSGRAAEWEAEYSESEDND